MRRNRQKINPREREFQAHLRHLGLNSVVEYRQWCAQHGFNKKTQKHPKQLERERRLAEEGRATKKLRDKKHRQRAADDLLPQLVRGKAICKNPMPTSLRRFSKTVRKKRKGGQDPAYRDALLRLIRHLQECRSKLLDFQPDAHREQHTNTYVEALAFIAGFHRQWLRPIEDWKPRSHNAGKQFASLLRHLLVRYEMPLFFDSVWFKAGSTGIAQRNWYAHVGEGRNIRHCELPIPYTKKMAHYFLTAPNNAGVEQALRWGQVLGLGGDVGLAMSLFGTRLCESFVCEEFWVTVIRWFIAHPMLDRAQAAPIIDYLYHQRFVPAIGDVPPQPNLSMHRREPTRLMRDVEAWHRGLARGNRYQVRDWTACGIQPFELEEGQKGSKSFKRWTIRELLGSKALVAEGKRMQHCVATYAKSCEQGVCSIWTMELTDHKGEVKKLLTIEVRNQERLIYQARGRCNRLMDEREGKILQRWANIARLKVSRYAN